MDTTAPPAGVVALTDGPLGDAPPAERDAASGAWVVFEGVVRRDESGRALSALRYEAYEPMTSRELTRLAAATVQRFGLTGLDVWHSVGDVPVGAVSFRLRVAAPHRAESLEAVAWFVDEMKRGVPIWKRPVWADPPMETPTDTRGGES